jgi:predicted nuclease of predicted toxin-antitoxin system
MSSDNAIWDYARDNDFTIVTQDSDFYERSLVYGHPPKVIWLRTGNSSTENTKKVLKKHAPAILVFGRDKLLGCFQIYSK